MLITHALPVWYGLLHRHMDQCTAQGHLTRGSYRVGDISVFCCNYRAVIRANCAAILIRRLYIIRINLRAARSFETFIACETKFMIIAADFRYASEKFYSRDDTFRDIRFGFGFRPADTRID